jgi:aryl-alcohol dehydrogenase-like predicted oxidoreductase
VAPTVQTAWLATAVSRLTGDPGRGSSEGQRYRLPLTTADGHKHAVSVQVDTHPAETRPYAVNQIANAWHIKHEDIINVLTNWTPEQLLAHLSTFKKIDLMPPTFRR